MKDLSNSASAFWSKSEEDVISQLRTNRDKGLTDEEARLRLKQYGLNQFAQKNKYQFLIDLLKSFLNPLVLLLLFASVLSAVVGDVRDFFLIAGIIFVSSFVSLYQHKKAENEAEKLKAKVILTATVLRNGEKIEVPFTHVTVGDIVVLSVGDILPADVRLLEAKEMTIDESTLTGESYPSSKEIAVIKEKNLPVSEQKNMAFTG